MSWKKFKQELLSNPETRVEYERLKPEFELLDVLLKARIEAGLSQYEVAARMGVKQPAVARLESASHSPSIRTLRNYAEAVGCKLRVTLVPHNKKKKSS